MSITRKWILGGIAGLILIFLLGFFLLVNPVRNAASETWDQVAATNEENIRLEAKIAQYEQGERFIEAVEREGGASLLAEAWVSPDHLPTLEEIRQPARWIDRVRPAVA